LHRSVTPVLGEWMLGFPTFAKAPAITNVVPVAVLVLLALWALRKLAKLALVLFVLAVLVAAFLWARGGL
jgi:hypothetical protein